jgi:eukaryotic-like serine/threonine-protein kinase
MLCVRGRVSDQLKVLDFGLVKDLDDGTDASVTNTTGLVGTPLYMAPEAILHPASITASADLYSLGAVAYFLLVGEPAFTGETTMEVCLKQVHEAPQPVASRAPQPVPPRLDDLVLSCLAKAPSDRPPSAAALQDRLAELQREHAWNQQDADSWWQARAGALIAAARAAHAASSSGAGPQTLAIDWAARHSDTVAA